MASRWLRQKQIVHVPPRHGWWVSHAQLPTVLPLAPDRWRIFCAGRDVRNRGSIIRVDVDPTRGMTVLDISRDRPVRHGPRGSFDCDGLGVTSVVAAGNGHLFTSAGMNATDTTPYRIAIGLMSSDDQGRSFARRGNGPILQAGANNPAGCSSGQIVRIGRRWHLWFSSWRGWDHAEGQPPEPIYDIRHAVSRDAKLWHQDANPAIAPRSPKEGGLARPWVMQNDQGFEMWYSIRSRAAAGDPAQPRYRLGYATSRDGLSWERRDADHGFDNPPQPGDWDHAMQCYASVIRSGGRDHMFYCGNDYGRFGFGHALRVKKTVQQNRIMP